MKENKMNTPCQPSAKKSWMKPMLIEINVELIRQEELDQLAYILDNNEFLLRTGSSGVGGGPT